MKSCQDNLMELRQKIHFAEDQLRTEKKNLYRATELVNDDKEKWSAEIQQEELKVQAFDQEIREKESKLQKVKVNFDGALEKILVLETENTKLRKEIQKAELQKQDELNKFYLEQLALEKELAKVQELQNELKGSSKWIRLLQEKELRGEEALNESVVSDEVKQLADDFTKKVEAFEENLKEIDRASLAPKKEKLNVLLENLQMVTNECNDMKKKINDIKKDIHTLEQS